MNEKNLYTLLDDIAHQDMPKDMDVLPALKQQFAARQRRTLSLPIMHLTRTAAIVVLVLVTSILVYAVARLGTDTDPGLRGTYIESLITPLNLSQTVGDITVTVDWAYADANRIAVAYRFEGEGAAVLRPTMMALNAMQLYTADGEELQPVRWNDIDTSTLGLIDANVYFDATVLSNDSDTIDLRFVVLSDVEFTFTLPFIRGIVIDTPQEVESNGLTVRFDRALITPSMTRIIYCYESPNFLLWIPGTVTLAYDDVLVANELGATYTWAMPVPTNGLLCQTHYFLATYETLPHTLTFTIESMHRQIYHTQDSMEHAAGIVAEYYFGLNIRHNRDSTHVVVPADPLLMEQAWQNAIDAADTNSTQFIDHYEGLWSFTIPLP